MSHFTPDTRNENDPLLLLVPIRRESLPAVVTLPVVLWRTSSLGVSVGFVMPSVPCPGSSSEGRGVWVGSLWWAPSGEEADVTTRWGAHASWVISSGARMSVEAVTVAMMAKLTSKTFLKCTLHITPSLFLGNSTFLIYLPMLTMQWEEKQNKIKPQEKTILCIWHTLFGLPLPSLIFTMQPKILVLKISSEHCLEVRKQQYYFQNEYKNSCCYTGNRLEWLN